MPVFLQKNDLDVDDLSGWDQVRVALQRVEEARRSGQDAKVEITNSNDGTTLRITLRSIEELEQYFNSHLRCLVLQGADEDSSMVSGRIIFC